MVRTRYCLLASSVWLEFGSYPVVLLLPFITWLGLSETLSLYLIFAMLSLHEIFYP